MVRVGIALCFWQRQLKKVPRGFGRVVRAARNIDVAVAITDGGAQHRAAIGQSRQGLPLQALQIEPPACVQRLAARRVVAANNHQIALTIQTTLGPVEVRRRRLREQAPGILPDIVAIDQSGWLVLASVARTTEQENVAAGVLGELDVTKPHWQARQIVPEAAGDVVAIPTRSRLSSGRAWCQKALGQVEMPLLIRQH